MLIEGDWGSTSYKGKPNFIFGFKKGLFLLYIPFYGGLPFYVYIYVSICIYRRPYPYPNIYVSLIGLIRHFTIGVRVI